MMQMTVSLFTRKIFPAIGDFDILMILKHKKIKGVNKISLLFLELFTANNLPSRKKKVMEILYKMHHGLKNDLNTGNNHY